MGIRNSCREDASLHPAPTGRDFELFCFHVNDRTWPYPAYAITGFGGPVIIDGEHVSLLGFPGPPNKFQDCYGPRKRDAGCDTTRTTRFKKDLAEYYEQNAAAGYKLPSPLDGWEGHHILPLAWGGRNQPDNGVFLTRSVHTEFSQWWCYFSLDGRFVNAEPLPFCRYPFANTDQHGI
jgi:hypothetical protein